MVFEAFSNVVSSKHITEICIVDDCSDLTIFNKLENEINNLKKINVDFQKVNLYRNDCNLGSFLNKLECVKKSKNEWVILLDSDNIIDIDYINIVVGLNNPKTIYAPSHAICESPILNFTEHSGKIVDKLEYKNLSAMYPSIWSCIFNTGNYYFNRENYLKCIELEESIENSLAFDAYYLVYLWIKNLNESTFEIVDSLKYIHRLHDESHFIKTKSNHNFLNEITDRTKLWN
jgi:hypothetical protein